MEVIKKIFAFLKGAPSWVRIIMSVLVAALVAICLYFGVACGTVTKKSFCSPDGCYVFTDSIGVSRPDRYY